MEKAFFDKLIAVQKSVGTIKKDKVNPFHKSKYADINAFLEIVKPVLTENGLFLYQPILTEDGKVTLHTIVTDGTEKLESTIQINQPDKIQEFGALITYLRRYSIQSLLSLEAEDDDGESVKNVGFKPKQKEYPAEPFPSDLPIRHGACDKDDCNGFMVEKDTAKGKVLACSAYPQCKNVKPFND